MMINRSIQYYCKRFLELSLLPWMVFAVCIGVASAQTECEINFYDAEKQFEIGNLDSVRSLLNHCLTEYSQDQRIRAHEFLALSYIAEDQQGNAEKEIVSLLKLNRNYRPQTRRYVSQSSRFDDLLENLRHPKMSISTELQRPLLPERTSVEDLWVFFVTSRIRLVSNLQLILEGSFSWSDSPGSTQSSQVGNPYIGIEVYKIPKVRGFLQDLSLQVGLQLPLVTSPNLASDGASLSNVNRLESFEPNLLSGRVITKYRQVQPSDLFFQLHGGFIVWHAKEELASGTRFDRNTWEWWIIYGLQVGYEYQAFKIQAGMLGRTLVGRLQGGNDPNLTQLELIMGFNFAKISFNPYFRYLVDKNSIEAPDFVLGATVEFLLAGKRLN